MWLVLVSVTFILGRLVASPVYVLPHTACLNIKADTVYHDKYIEIYVYMAVSAGAGSGPVMSVGLKTFIPFLTFKNDRDNNRSKVYGQYGQC